MIGWTTALAVGTAGLAGAVVGSFAATVALRLPSGESPWHGRSRCDGCARTLSWAETVPVAGYIRAGGRCTACGHEIDHLHLCGEILGAGIASAALLLDPNLNGAVMALLGICMLAAALIDIKTRTLPNGLNLLVALMATILAWTGGRLVAGLIAATVSGFLLLAVKWLLDRRHGRTMLGLGDVKLICAASLLLGEWTAPMMALAAALGLAVMVTTRKKLIPFGPMIAASSFMFALVAQNGVTLP